MAREELQHEIDHVVESTEADYRATVVSWPSADGKQVTLKLERPKAQASAYEDNDGKASQTKPGVQERVIPKSSPQPSQQPN